MDKTVDLSTGTYCIRAQNVQLQNGAAASLSNFNNSLRSRLLQLWRVRRPSVRPFVADKERFSTMGKRGAFAGIARKDWPAATRQEGSLP